MSLFAHSLGLYILLQARKRNIMCWRTEPSVEKWKGDPMGPGMGQVEMMEAWDGSVEFTAEGTDPKEACKIRTEPERTEKGWEAKAKKKLFAKMHTLMSHIIVA